MAHLLETGGQELKRSLVYDNANYNIILYSTNKTVLGVPSYNILKLIVYNFYIHKKFLFNELINN